MITIEQLYKKYLECGAVCTDTRAMISGSIFFALKGPSFNANEFAALALQNGATYAVVDDAAYVKNENYILVNDGLQSLQRLAHYHRSRLTIPIIGLTGSNGKTTSKELLNAVLQKKYKTFATHGNLNNHIGVPLSILSITSAHEIAIIEMGANHVGEIATLAAIANPTHGLITNLGRAHIGTFGGFENIVRAKSELYTHLINHHGQVFINSQNPILMVMAKRFSAPVFYPNAGDYYHAQFISADPFVNFNAANGERVQTQLIGKYNFENIAAALCVGKFFGVDATAANEAIAQYQPQNMRSQMVRRGTNIIILDAYNANPSSMQASIENLSLMENKNKVLILGDMYELEDEAECEHRAIGEFIRKKKFQHVYFVGELFQSARVELPTAKYFENKNLLIDELKKNPLSDSVVLIKASRGMRLEEILNFI